MNDMELADYFPVYVQGCAAYWAECDATRRNGTTEGAERAGIAAVVAALRRGPERPPSGEMGYEEYHDGIIGVFKMNADGSRDLKVLTPQASEQFRAMLSAAEAEGRKS